MPRTGRGTRRRYRHPVIGRLTDACVEARADMVVSRKLLIVRPGAGCSADGPSHIGVRIGGGGSRRWPALCAGCRSGCGDRAQRIRPGFDGLCVRRRGRAQCPAWVDRLLRTAPDLPGEQSKSDPATSRPRYRKTPSWCLAPRGDLVPSTRLRRRRPAPPGRPQRRRRRPQRPIAGIPRDGGAGLRGAVDRMRRGASSYLAARVAGGGGRSVDRDGDPIGPGWGARGVFRSRCCNRRSGWRRSTRRPPPMSRRPTGGRLGPGGGQGGVRVSGW